MTNRKFKRGSLEDYFARKRAGQTRTGIPGWDERAAKRLERQDDVPWKEDDDLPVRTVYRGRMGETVTTWKPNKKRGSAKRLLYIAYGSNLHKRSMWQRCPTAIFKGRITLDNARLVFRGVADLIVEKGSQCPAGVWEISEDDEARLDAFEGVESGVYTKHYVKVGRGWGHKEALVYKMNDDGIYPPSAWYAGIIRRGYRDFKLDEGYLDEAIKHSFVQKNPTKATRKRRWRQKSGDVQRRLVTMPLEIAEQHKARMQELAERAKEEATKEMNGKLTAAQVFKDAMLPQQQYEGEE